MPLGPHFRGLRVIGHDHQTGSGVRQNVADLAGRQGRIHRHGDRTRGENSQVGDGPLRSTVRQNGDTVARSHSEALEPQAEVTHLVKQLPAGPVDQPVAGATADKHRLRISAGDVEGELGQRANEWFSHLRRGDRRRFVHRSFS